MFYYFKCTTVFLISLRVAEQVCVHLLLNDNALTTSLIDVLSNITGSPLAVIIKTGHGKLDTGDMMHLHLRKSGRQDGYNIR